VVICPHQALLLAPLPGKKKISARRVSHAQSFTLFIVLLYFIFACIVLSKPKKLASLVVVISLLLVHYVVP
jgi:uncharacterized membrane protein